MPRIETRALARVIGPFLAIVTGIIVAKAPTLGTYLSGTFDNPVVVWMLGAMLLFSGLLIIAFHQIWNNPAAFVISLFGWFLAIRGFILLAAPELMQSGAEAASTPDNVLWVRIGFSFLVLIGLWLTYVGWIAKPPTS